MRKKRTWSIGPLWWHREAIVYVCLWVTVFVAPMVQTYVAAFTQEEPFMDWPEVFRTWTFLVSFLFVFLVHNFVLTPLLLKERRRSLYILLVVILIMFTYAAQKAVGPSRYFSQPGPPPPSLTNRIAPPDEPLGPPDEPNGPPRDLGREDLSIVLGYILIIGMNVGIKLYFRSEQQEARRQLSERRNLEQQMEYLKYQVNPHFFMNTLNNIHALIDIDPSKAKSSVIELSRMMRYVLYEGSRDLISVKKEMDFLRSYIELMRLRYYGKVSIECHLPPVMPEKLIPPLLLIIFVENAFKHGISYKEPSFIRVAVTMSDETLSFRCENSKYSLAPDGHKGVGLANVRKRLSLLYGSRCSLVIENGDKAFNVKLTIPFAEKPSDEPLRRSEVTLPLE